MEQPSPTPETQPDALKPPAISLPARLLNVFAAPGEVFQSVKGVTHSAANWLVPVALAGLIGVVTSWVIFSQPAIKQQIHEQQAKAMDQQVKSGKMTQAQADQALEMIEKFSGPTTMAIFGALSIALLTIARVFLWALVLWLMGRWVFKRGFGYMKGAEVAGLAMMITALAMIVNTLLGVTLSRMVATPGPALLVHDFDLKNKMHMLLGAANLFNFWFVAVVSLGLAKLAEAPFVKSALFVFVFWSVVELLLIGVGLGQLAL